MSQKHVALVGPQAFAMLNFRSSFIRELVSRGFKVSAFSRLRRLDPASDPYAWSRSRRS